MPVAAQRNCSPTTTRRKQQTPEPSAPARSREHPHPPRSGGRVRAPGDALLHRQGLVRDAAPGAEGVLSRADSRSRCCTSTPAYKFREMIEFRDDYGARDRRRADRAYQRAGDRRRRQSLRAGHAERCCGLLKTQALLDALAAGGFDAAFGGARRDEEKSRAKERIYSFRDAAGQWDPKNQRPELWNLYNARIATGREHPRLPAFQLDRARRLAVHPRGKHSRSCRSTSPRSAPMVVRGDALIPVEQDVRRCCPAKSRRW